MKLSNFKTLKILLNGEYDLSHKEFRLAVTILSFRNESTLQCNPTQTTLSKLTKLKRQHVSKLISSLKSKNVLESIRTINLDNPMKGVNQYFFLHDLLKAQSIASQPNFTGNPDDLLSASIKPRAQAASQSKNQQHGA